MTTTTTTLRMLAVTTMLGGAVGLACALPPPLPPLPKNSKVVDEVLDENSKAVITWQNAEVEFGDIYDTDTPEGGFKFTNTGESALIIRKIKPSCGCTAAELEQTVYMPGESGEISVRYNPRGKSGPQHRTITVSTNDMSAPTQTIAINAHVRPIVMFDPPMINFGRVEKGDGKTMQVQVIGRIEGFEATRATVRNYNLFDVKIIGTEDYTENDEKLRRTTIELKLKEGAKIGRHDDEVQVRTTDKRRPLEKVVIRAEVIGDLTAVPPRLSLGRVLVGTSFQRELNIASRSETPFKIMGISHKDGPKDLTFEHEPVFSKEGQTESHVHRIVVQGTAQAGSPRIAGTIIVSTNIPDEPTIEVPFYGAVNTRSIGSGG